ncbi:hypothetical protein MJO28_016376 [Puccinia striiformis f. sp. tritici]|uniref:Uncharacterized protein n=1 Tax=Puccinia striiformis f. sp. tritici TaxID=168172 RepID=A0ACC0DPN6_9BASI|nr:hypothetical protein MJO28_016376 [Puccinia striiformis f. sp. tritici]
MASSTNLSIVCCYISQSATLRSDQDKIPCSLRRLEPPAKLTRTVNQKDPRPTESVFFSHQTTEMDGRRLVEKAGPNSWDEWSFTIAQGDNAAKLLDVGSRVQAYAFSVIF